MEELIIFPALFIGLPWVVMHYITKWKTMSTLTNEDEDLLEDLYVMARRLDDRMDTIERIIKADNPEWKADRLIGDLDVQSRKLDEMQQMLNERTAR